MHKTIVFFYLVITIAYSMSNGLMQVGLTTLYCFVEFCTRFLQGCNNKILWHLDWIKWISTFCMHCNHIVFCSCMWILVSAIKWTKEWISTIKPCNVLVPWRMITWLSLTVIISATDVNQNVTTIKWIENVH